MMKVLAKTTRGEGRPKDLEKAKLRQIVNEVYDEVEIRGIVTHFANVKSAGKRYYIDWFRQKDGWMLSDEAEEVKDQIESVISELGYSDMVTIELIPENSSFMMQTYGDTVYIVRGVFNNK